jgi:hypothetical protein
MRSILPTARATADPATSSQLSVWHYAGHGFPLAMSNLAVQIIGLSEEEQAHIQAVTDRLATDPELRSELEAAEWEGVDDGFPPLSAGNSRRLAFGLFGPHPGLFSGWCVTI